MPYASPARRLACVLLLIGAGTVAACGEERERLDVPQVRLELDDTVVAPGDSVGGRIVGTDEIGGVLRLAVRLCIDTGFFTARINPFRVDSASFRFLLPVPASTPENSLVIVEGQVNDAQDFFVVRQDTIVARSPGVPPAPATRQPSCERPTTGAS